MSVQALIGKKIDQTQGFLEDGTRVPISRLLVLSNMVIQTKTKDHEGYNAIQVGFDTSKKTNKALNGHSKKAGQEKVPRFVREIRVEDTHGIALASQLSIVDVLELGDVVDVSGVSKGKGFAGVVKRHHFKGGPRTHGQSDRERAPGSIGQTTTPGRVYKGKRMAGRMGGENKTVKNLEVLDIAGDILYVKGLVPGSKGSMLIVKKTGLKNKNFRPLFKKNVEKPDIDGTREGGENAE